MGTSSVTTIHTQGKQWLRQVKLVIADSVTSLAPYGMGDLSTGADSDLTISTQAIDLSQFRIRFEIHSGDTETPNTAVIRVYNLSHDTAQKISAEFQTVTLSAGYQYQQNNLPIIFQGTVKQFERGKENNVDSYLEIMAAEADEPYNFAVVNTTIPAGSTPFDRATAVAKAMGLPLARTVQKTLDNTGGIMARGRVLYGMARAHMRVIADSYGCRWSIQKGEIVLIPLNGYLPGDPIIVNSTNGMVGIPKATDNGISVQMLLNGTLQIGGRIQLNNDDITQSQFNMQQFPNREVTQIARTNYDGFYRVLSIDHTGDTRGQEWYSNVICLSLDPTTGNVVGASASG